MPVTERHEQTSKALETLAKCRRPPRLTAENIAFALPVRAAVSVAVSLPK